MGYGVPLDDAWLTGYAARLGVAAAAQARPRWVDTPSGARLAFIGGVVVKLHHHRTIPEALAKRLAAVVDSPLADFFVTPLSPEVSRAPGGSLVTAWPAVPVLDPDGPLPWAAAGRLLARLHCAALPSALPVHGATDRVARALARARRLPTVTDTAAYTRADSTTMLTRLGEALVREVTRAGTHEEPAERHTESPSVVHGDWHLGQLGRWGDGWRLLDVDDLGVGDPAWDLARPAGFWAAGLLDEASWRTFLGAYRAAGGPAVPPAGDPWPRLDLPARCAVFVAAVRSLRGQTPAGAGAALLHACRQM
ncbi:MAG: aminoglycoside phosphotransferase family protein [Intrasporangium sp.]|uniref:phosphotransferase family protein n=1 Tax=Intrasporangium sp. TaxID=1925024 RepID=UPI00264779DA|nr:hypothetical protein [Intrasporangium sp.]MDN5796485.1 aminoglycoside phosphotransferase family protein [Intrasporangium sp.]